MSEDEYRADVLDGLSALVIASGLGVLLVGVHVVGSWGNRG